MEWPKYIKLFCDYQVNITRKQISMTALSQRKTPNMITCNDKLRATLKTTGQKAYSGLFYYLNERHHKQLFDGLTLGCCSGPIRLD